MLADVIVDLHIATTAFVKSFGGRRTVERPHGIIGHVQIVTGACIDP
mgnify:CR=1 FL=1